jgi:hypothetical protein
MTDHSIGLPGVPAKGEQLRSVAAYVLGSQVLPPATAWLGVGLVSAGLAGAFWQDEGEFANILFTLGVTGALVAILTLLTRRALFASVLVGCLVVSIVVAASAKHAAMNMAVHAYDLVFYLGSWPTVSYLWSDHRRYVLTALAALLVAALAALRAYRLDGTRVPRRWSAVVLAVSVLVAWHGAMNKGERRHAVLLLEPVRVVVLRVLGRDARDLLARDADGGRAARRDGGPLHDPDALPTAGRRRISF